MVPSAGAEGNIVIDDHDIRSLLTWRYTTPLLPNPGARPGGPVVLARRGVARSRNPIDRAVWPRNFVRIEHEKLLYTQDIATRPA